MSSIPNLIFIFGAKYLYLIVIIITFIWFLIQSKLKQKEVLILICICLPLIFIISLLASYVYYNPRPFVLGNFKSLIPHQADNGFPSRHVLLLSAISAVIFFFSRRISLLLWILTLFVGFSRVYAGVHHIIDVIGSILISIILVTLIYFFMKYLKNRKLSVFLK